MVDPIATPDDVTQEIDTGIDTSRIQHYLDDAAFENDQHNDVSSQSDAVRKRIEYKLAAIKILTRPDREVASKEVGPVSTDYEVSTVEELREEVDQLDDSGSLVDRRPQADFEVF